MISKAIKTYLFIFLLQLINVSLLSQIYYVSPKPGSAYNNTKTSIIIKFRTSLKGEVNFSNIVKLIGDKSKTYDFEYKFRNNRLLIYPKQPFSLGEDIHVLITDTLIQNNGFVIYPFETFFSVSNENIMTSNNPVYSSGIIKSTVAEIPANFPKMSIVLNEAPAQGKVFFYNISALASDNNRFLTILDNNGIPDYTRQENDIGLNFTLQPSGYMSFWNGGDFAIMDTSYSVINTIGCGNGYTADWHEFIHLPNGHSILFAYDIQLVDMSLLVSGGDPNAEVEGLVIQELDENENVIFQWRSWDHFNILDAEGVDFTASQFSYVHGNAMELDSDGNLLLSSRLLNEITKIDMTSGEIIWRLGGKNNEFDFLNDPDMFCRQHDIRRIENGNITLFDNGECHPPSKAKEYELNETIKTAVLVWEYSRNSFSPLMGSVQRLENGNTFINWGMIKHVSESVITEVGADNRIIFELYFNEINLLYRSHRFKWGGDSYTSVPKNIIDNNDYNIFPNPAKDIVYIRLNSQAKVSEVSIYDINGRLIKKPIYKIENSNLLEISVNDLKSGLYFLKIHINDKWLIEQIIISR